MQGHIPTSCLARSTIISAFFSNKERFCSANLFKFRARQKDVFVYPQESKITYVSLKCAGIDKGYVFYFFLLQDVFGLITIVLEFWISCYFRTVVNARVLYDVVTE